MPPAARKGDIVLHDEPHCHARIHPPVPPTANAHAPQPYPITQPCSPNVKIMKAEAARVTDKTIVCNEATCIQAAEGVIAKGSMTVMINGLNAARVGDSVLWPACVAAPIPSKDAHIMPPGAPTVIIGG